MTSAGNIPSKKQRNPIRQTPPGWTGMEPRSFSDFSFLWQDEPRFLVWSVIRNNYGAVVRNLEQLQGGRTLVNSTVQLFDRVMAMSAEDRAQVLDVPWQTGENPEQDRAYGTFRQVATSGAGTGTSMRSKSFPLLGVAGLFGVVSSVLANEQDSEAQEDAQSQAQRDAALAQQRQAEAAAKRADTWQRVKPFVLYGGLALAILTILLIIRHRS